MKAKFGMAVLILMAVGITVWCLASGISGLSKSQTEAPSRYSQKGDLCEFEVSYAKEVYEIEHKINGLIPFGTEHFFLVLIDDDLAPMLVKANTSWFSDNFTEDGEPKKTVSVTGEVVEFERDFQSSISEINMQLAPTGQSISTSSYVDAIYLTRYIMQLSIGIVLVTVCAAVIVMIMVHGRSRAAVNALTVYCSVAVLYCVGAGLFLGLV